MRTYPTITQCKPEPASAPKPQTKINCAFNLDTAGWIMARYKNQRLVNIELSEYKGQTNFYCEFETEPGEKCDYKEFVKMKEEQPEELKQTVAAGLEQLSGYLNQLLKESKKITALNKNEEAAYV